MGLQKDKLMLGVRQGTCEKIHAVQYIYNLKEVKRILWRGVRY